MKILAIETATEACSAALLWSDELKTTPEVAVRFQHAPREHTKLILPMLDEVLEEANTSLTEVDAIAFGRGPGAFTGLRIASGIAQGLALAGDIPVIPVSTLKSLAQQVISDLEEGQSVIVALDARMNEVYWGVFIRENNTLVIQGKEQVSSPQILIEGINNKQNILAIGNGWEVYFPDLPKNIMLIREAFPSAEYVAQLALPLLLSGKSFPPEEAQPIYIRDNVAKKSTKLA